MKKIYILALAIGAFSLSVNAQTNRAVELTDDFESYNLGPLAPQADHWRTWNGDGGSDDANVTDNEAFSGEQSLLISNNKLSDMILLIPNAPLSGEYTVQFYLYITTGKSGYFNMQAALTPDGTLWNQALMGGNVYFNCKDDDTGNGGNTPGQGGVTGVIDCSAFEVVFTYPQDEWFKVTNVYDLTNQTWSMEINGDLKFSGYPFEFGPRVFIELAAIDFYSASSNNDMYIDNVTLAEGRLATEDFTADKFSVYPNPVKDMLNIKSAASVDNVTVYDILGKVVLQENPGKISPAINMSSLASGSYLVKVTIGNTSNTVKVLK